MKRLILFFCFILLFGVVISFPNFEDYWQIEKHNTQTKISAVARYDWSSFSEEKTNNIIRLVEHYELPIDLKDRFLYRYNGSYIDLSSLSHVVRIGDQFLADAKTIDTIDGMNFSKVEHIGSGFMTRTRKLKSLDLSSFYNVQHIGHAFMYNSAIDHINFTPLKSLNYIGDSFMSEASVKVQNVDLTPLLGVQHIGKCFFGKDSFFDKYKFDNSTEHGIINQFMADREQFLNKKI